MVASTKPGTAAEREFAGDEDDARGENQKFQGPLALWLARPVGRTIGQSPEAWRRRGYLIPLGLFKVNPDFRTQLTDYPVLDRTPHRRRAVTAGCKFPDLVRGPCMIEFLSHERSPLATLRDIALCRGWHGATRGELTPRPCFSSKLRAGKPP